MKYSIYRCLFIFVAFPIMLVFGALWIVSGFISRKSEDVCEFLRDKSFQLWRWEKGGDKKL